MIQTFEDIKKFVKDGGDPNEVDEHGNTILSRIIRSPRNSTSIKFLLKNGADVNHRLPNGNSILTLVHNVKMLRLFVESGGDLNNVDSIGGTYNHYATNIGTLEYSISAGSDVRVRDKLGRTCLHYMVTRGSIPDDMIRLYIRNGIDLNTRDFDGKTALHMSKKGWVSGCLIKYGADVNSIDNVGRTPLHCAIAELVYRINNKVGIDTGFLLSESIENVKNLVIMGASLDIRYSKGFSCMDEIVPILCRFSPDSSVGIQLYSLQKLVEAHQ